MRGATRRRIVLTQPTGISIHAPREGSDKYDDIGFKQIPPFQSTLPVRGATRRRWPWLSRKKYFNPRSPGGERPMDERYEVIGYRISIHAPREGSDQGAFTRLSVLDYFNPRSP